MGYITDAGYLPQWNYGLLPVGGGGWTRIPCGYPRIPLISLQDISLTYYNDSNESQTVRLWVKIYPGLIEPGSGSITIGSGETKVVGFGIDAVRTAILNMLLYSTGKITAFVGLDDGWGTAVSSSCDLLSAVVPVVDPYGLLPGIGPLPELPEFEGPWIGPPQLPVLPTIDVQDLPLVVPGAGVHITCQTGWGCVAVVNPNCSSCKRCPCDCINFCYCDANCQGGLNAGCCTAGTAGMNQDQWFAFWARGNIYDSYYSTMEDYCGIKPIFFGTELSNSPPPQLTPNKRNFIIGSFGGHFLEYAAALFQYKSDSTFTSALDVTSSFEQHGLRAYLGFRNGTCIPSCYDPTYFISEIEIPVTVLSVGTPAGHLGVMWFIMPSSLPGGYQLFRIEEMYIRVESCYDINPIDSVVYFNEQTHPSTPNLQIPFPSPEEPLKL